MSTTQFASRILTWYARNGRDLPWRAEVTPYRTWVSEVMLQQTRVEVVRPYFQRWMARFPSIRRLASAPQMAVLAAWEGLGYYSRARNLHRAAKIVVRDHRGRIPSELGALRKLPGVGAYTSAAIASMAFGQDVVALDGNIRRVLARAFCIEIQVDSGHAEARLKSLADENLPRGQAGEFNQALMDLGSLVCLPRQPRCDACPVAGLCKARRRGLQGLLPVRIAKEPVPRYLAAAAVIVDREKVLIRRRRTQGLLGGMWEFPKTELKSRLARLAGLRRNLASGLPGLPSLRIDPGEILTVVPHAYSHFHVTVHAFVCTARSAPGVRGARWALIDQLSRFPMGKIDRTIADRLQAIRR